MVGRSTFRMQAILSLTVYNKVMAYTWTEIIHMHYFHSNDIQFNAIEWERFFNTSTTTLIPSCTVPHNTIATEEPPCRPPSPMQSHYNIIIPICCWYVRTQVGAWDNAQKHRNRPKNVNFRVITHSIQYILDWSFDVKKK